VEETTGIIIDVHRNNCWAVLSLKNLRDISSFIVNTFGIHHADVEVLVYFLAVYPLLFHFFSFLSTRGRKTLLTHFLSTPCEAASPVLPMQRHITQQEIIRLL